MKKSLGGKIAFGVGGAVKDMAYTLSAYYLMYYYQNVLGLSPSFVGTVLMIARFFDALNDPIMGVLVAKTRSRWGRFRPWIFSGTVLNAFTLYALFAAPKMPETGIMVWFTVVYLLWGITYTMLDIPYWSMIPAAAETMSDREKMAVIGRTCAGVGGAIMAVFALLAVDKFGGGTNDREGFRILALIVSIAFLAGEIFCCLRLKEKRPETAAPSTSVKQMFKELFHNDQTLTVSGIIVLVNVATYITTNLVIYFFKYDYGGEMWETTYTLFIAIGSVSLVLGMVLVYPLLRRKKVSNEKIFKGSVLTAITGYLVLLGVCLSGASGKFIPLVIAGCMGREYVFFRTARKDYVSVGKSDFRAVHIHNVHLYMFFCQRQYPKQAVKIPDLVYTQYRVIDIIFGNDLVCHIHSEE